MRSGLTALVAALALLAFAADDGEAPLARSGFASVRPPDVRTTQYATYARRGSLGRDDYVVTNVPPCASAYVINEVKAGKLRDRAVNIATVSSQEASFELPLKRTVEGYARAMLFVVTAECGTRVEITGADSLWGTVSKGNTLDLCEGTHLIQIIEIGKSSYLVESRELVEFKEE